MPSDHDHLALHRYLAQHRGDTAPAPPIRYPWTHDCSRDCDLAGDLSRDSAAALGALFSDYFTLVDEYTAGIPASHIEAKLAELLAGQPPQTGQP